MRLLVCGGRNYGNAKGERGLLEAAITALDPTLVIHGCAPGADYIAEMWAANAEIPVLQFPARWRHYGPGAGPIRNSQMLDEGKPDAVLAAPGGDGTADMIRKALVAGIPIHYVGVPHAI